jgi:hypothetical protein
MNSGDLPEAFQPFRAQWSNAGRLAFSFALIHEPTTTEAAQSSPGFVKGGKQNSLE